MNLTDYINKKTVNKISFDFNDEKMDIWVKPLMADGKNDMLNSAGSLMNISKKAVKAKEDGIDSDLTPQEIKDLTTYRQKQTFYLLCDKTGKRLFPNYSVMLETLEASLLDEICAQIETYLTPEKSEDIEGN